MIDREVKYIFLFATILTRAMRQKQYIFLALPIRCTDIEINATQISQLAPGTGFEEV